MSMNIAINKARKTGIGLVTARRSNHFGAAGYYARMALEYDLIGPIYDNQKSLYLLLYVYEIKNSYKPTLNDSWVYIENEAKIKKENDLLIEIIKNLKHNTLIKYYN